MSTAFKSIALATAATLPFSSAMAASTAPAPTTTPIKQLIVVVGENVTFDTLFATYKSPTPGQSVLNLLSQNIVQADGTPGRFFRRAQQNIGSNPNGSYSINPIRVGPYAALPQPLSIGVLNPLNFTTNSGTPDTRYPTNLPAGPYQITNGKVTYTGTFAQETGDPVHRFFQMWQQTGGSNAYHDMFLWPAVSTGTGGSNGSGSPTPSNAQQGGELMGFFNMATGDAATFKSLADTYALADNYHQGVMGGTGMNFFMLATGDMPVYNKGGQLATPPSNQIENPNPQPGTADFFTEDGYSGGSYAKCADATQPGVGEILSYLNRLNRASNCQTGAYYLLNNYNMPYDVSGNATLDANNNPVVANGSPVTTAFTAPPQAVPTIGEALSAKGVSWRWYTGGRENADFTSDPLFVGFFNATYAQVRPNYPAGATYDAIVTAALTNQARVLYYNAIGDALNYSSNVVNTPALAANLKGLTSFNADVANGTLPAVSFVVPMNLDSGHPGYSVSAKYELFLKNLIAQVKASPQWASTAIVVTTDEGGGYFDTGMNQTLDFFGDGSRIPMIVVSPYAKTGFVDHTYYDHVSILKFIERNWSVPPLSTRSRDRLPNPVHPNPNAYLPTNQPAIGDLMNMFTFSGN